MFYITGDTHRNFDRVYNFCKNNNTSKDDVMIILGDAGINFLVGRADGYKDTLLKAKLEDTLPITLFCIHGNHEQRPSEISSYEKIEFNGGIVYREKEFPSLLFGKDGEIYDFNGKKVMVIGGAYSIDKYYRLAFGYPYFYNEQPSEEIKKYVEEKLEELNYRVDYVLSHTAPSKFEPTDIFSESIDQTSIDKTTEKWLDCIEDKLEYEKWYCGHYHVDRDEKKLHFRYKRIHEL